MHTCEGMAARESSSSITQHNRLFIDVWKCASWLPVAHIYVSHTDSVPLCSGKCAHGISYAPKFMGRAVYATLYESMGEECELFFSMLQQDTWQRLPEKEGVYFGSESEGRVYHGEGMVTGAGGSCSHCILGSRVR